MYGLKARTLQEQGLANCLRSSWHLLTGGYSCRTMETAGPSAARCSARDDTVCGLEDVGHPPFRKKRERMGHPAAWAKPLVPPLRFAPVGMTNLCGFVLRTSGAQLSATLFRSSIVFAYRAADANFGKRARRESRQSNKIQLTHLASLLWAKECSQLESWLNNNIIRCLGFKSICFHYDL
jgi:hypothetical protein